MQKRTYLYKRTHIKKTNINSKTCTIEKDKFKTKSAQNIDNNRVDWGKEADWGKKTFCFKIEKLLKNKKILLPCGDKHCG